MDSRNLDGEAGRQAAEWVRALPEDEAPSLAWRAALNEGLRAEAARRERRRFRWAVLRPTLGLATAAAFAAVVFAPRPTSQAAPIGGHIEAGLIALHQEAVRTDDIVGTGVRPAEAPAAPSFRADPLDDLEVL